VLAGRPRRGDTERIAAFHRPPEHAMFSPLLVDESIRGAVPSGVEALRDIATLFYEQGWSRGTSSNYSLVIGHKPTVLLLTASGKDKRRLKQTDFVIIDDQGKSIGPSPEKPSAETGLHLALATQPGVGSVLHTHSVWGTLLSDLYAGAGGFWIEGYEMLKGLAGVGTHEHRQWVTIFDNNQDIAALAKQVSASLADPAQPPRHGFLIRKHGLYTWGRDVDEARRHVEIFEFLFEVVGRTLTLKRGL
jgi:methylthioribulose-1-phosphate dehydratase